MLKLENVHIRRGDYVVADNIDLTLEQGKVYSVLGPNGTGKSSLMKTIFGEVAHKGTIRYGDEALSKIHLQSWRKRIGYMPQDTAAEASLTALEVVLLGRMDALHMHVGDELLHEAANIMAELGIGHLAHRDVMRLSGGQRQLVMFAQVMLRRPEILMLDEPVSTLDMHHAKQTRTGEARTEGKRVIGVPRLQANLGAEWDVPGATGLALDARLIHTGASYADALRDRKSVV